ncbi:MAG: anhydro-N-acetylmuramic acid kinase [Alphaproteobacteria bacterium]|nr:anhydro-N-acetylmuramic acid kinase [Alphaproteobacteria bacterium]
MSGIVTALGLMSGTSMDGIDVAVIDTDGEHVAAFGPSATYPYPDDLSAALRVVVADAKRVESDNHAELDRRVTDAQTRAVERLLEGAGIDRSKIAVVGFHGQTILHRPERRATYQLGNGAAMAERLGIDVVNRFRDADLAAGGQGAPLAPLYHRALARDLERPLAVLNLGGVGNVTYLDGDTVIAFDTGPANAMIDDWMLKHSGRAYDADGRLAASGTVDRAALARLMDHPYFAKKPPKSLDRNDFSATPVQGLAPADGAATLVAFTVETVRRSLDHLPARPKRWLVTGGGRLNPTIMTALAEALKAPVAPVEAVGWQGDALEAQCFAFLAVRSLRGLNLSVPTTTGAPRPMTGGVLHRALKAA